MRRLLTLSILMLLSSHAYAEFVLDNSSLPPTKTALTPLPPGADPNKYIRAADYNALMNANLDLRTAVVNGKYHGLAAQASQPVPVNSTNFFWLKTNNQLHFVYAGPTDNQIAYGPITTKGDMLVYNGTNFVRLPVGTNGHVLTADSVEVSGTKWAAIASNSLQSVYDASTGAPVDVTFTNTDGGIRFRQDAGAAVTSLFRVSNNGATADFLSITSNSTQFLKSGMADGAAAIAVEVDTTATWSNATAKLFRVRNNGTERINILASGALNQSMVGIATAQTVGASLTNTTAATGGATQQYSPVLEECGTAWDADGSVSRKNCVGLQLRPISANATTAELDFLIGNDEGALTRRFYMDYNVAGNGIARLIGDHSDVYFMNTSGYGMYATTTSAAFLIAGAADYGFNSSGLIATVSGRTLGTTSFAWTGLHNDGQLSCKYNVQSDASYTIQATDCKVIMTNAGARTVTLIAANAVRAGWFFTVKDGNANAGTNNVTINRAGGDTIVSTATGATSVVINTNGGTAKFISNGVDTWFTE